MEGEGGTQAFVIDKRVRALPPNEYGSNDNEFDLNLVRSNLHGSCSNGP